jgi:hypothetical protein
LEVEGVECNGDVGVVIVVSEAEEQFFSATAADVSISESNGDNDSESFLALLPSGGNKDDDEDG